jgi:hypothetical protein
MLEFSDPMKVNGAIAASAWVIGKLLRRKAERARRELARG